MNIAITRTVRKANPLVRIALFVLTAPAALGRAYMKALRDERAEKGKPATRDAIAARQF